MNGKLLEIKTGATILIKLESLATSGYLWDCIVDDTSIVEVEKNEKENMSSLKSGSNGMEVFAIKGLKKGATKISFKQSRKWEQDKSAIKSRFYNIKVD